MTKIADVEGDLAQYKEDTNLRLDRLEQSVEALRVESKKLRADSAQARADVEKRHQELLTLLMKAPPATHLETPSSTQMTAAGPPRLTAGPPLPRPPPLTGGLLSAPGFSHGPQSSTGVPPYGQSYIPPLLFDSQGMPIPVKFEMEESSYSQPPKCSQPHTAHSIPMFGHGPGLYSTTKPFVGDTGYGRGPSHTGDRTWLLGDDYRLRKLKMPIFEGEDVYGWVYRVERFFDMQGMVTTGERLRAAVLCMEGQALSWFRWSDRRIPFRSWEH